MTAPVGLPRGLPNYQAHDGLPNRPVFRRFPVELAAAMLAEAAPVEGSTPTRCLADFANQVEPNRFGNGYPRFYTG